MVQIPVEPVVEAVRALGLAGRWDVAEQVLTAAAGDGTAERAALAMAAAQLAVDGDFWRRTHTSAAALDLAGQALAEAAEQPSTALLGFDLELMRLRQDYFSELFGPDGPRFGPDQRDPAVLDALAGRAERLRDTAPDRRRGGAAAFCAGLVEDNLRGDSTAARPLFAEAVAAGEQSGDDLLTSEALRHLGYLNDQAGDHDLALDQWRRATTARQRAGCVPLTLAQQLLVAETAAAGGAAWVAPQVQEIRRWAQALGLAVLTAQADAVLGSLAETAEAGEAG
jgi:hypothetical protein